MTGECKIADLRMQLYSRQTAEKLILVGRFILVKWKHNPVSLVTSNKTRCPLILIKVQICVLCFLEARASKIDRSNHSALPMRQPLVHQCVTGHLRRRCHTNSAYHASKTPIKNEWIHVSTPPYAFTLLIFKSPAFPSQVMITIFL